MIRVGYTGDYESWIANMTPPVTAGQVNFAEESTRQSLPSSVALNFAACHGGMPQPDWPH